MGQRKLVLRRLRAAIARAESEKEISLADTMRRLTDEAREKSGPRTEIELDEPTTQKLKKAVIRDAKKFFIGEFLPQLKEKAETGDEFACCIARIHHVYSNHSGAHLNYLSALRSLLQQLFELNRFQTHFSCIELQVKQEICPHEKTQRTYDGIVFVVSW